MSIKTFSKVTFRTIVRGWAFCNAKMLAGRIARIEAEVAASGLPLAKEDLGTLEAMKKYLAQEQEAEAKR